MSSQAYRIGQDLMLIKALFSSTHLKGHGHSEVHTVKWLGVQEPSSLNNPKKKINFKR